MIEHEIGEFGRKLGLPDLALDERGIAAMDVRGLGSFTLELREGTEGEDELLIHVARPVTPSDVDLPRRLLTRCSWRGNSQYPLAGGLHRDRLILLTRFPLSRVRASLLENAIRFLADQADEIAGF